MVDSRYILTLYPLNNKVKEKVCVKNMQLSDSIREIKGIGEKSEKLFAKLGISTVEELLFFYPREYEIVENIRPINEVQEGHIVVVSGTLGSKPRLYNNPLAYNQTGLNHSLYTDITSSEFPYPALFPLHLEYSEQIPAYY